MIQKIEVRTAEASFDLTMPNDLRELFVEGISQAAIGFPYSKLVFHSAQPPSGEQQVEQREAVLRMVIPTPILLEMCANILRGLMSNKENMLVGVTDVMSQITKLIEKNADLVPEVPITVDVKSRE
jgi:hypothetical protein